MDIFNGKGSMNWPSTICSVKFQAAIHSRVPWLRSVAAKVKCLASLYPRLEEKHRNIIRKLKLEIPATQDEP